MIPATDPVVIAGYARTPIGSFRSALSSVKATELGALAVRAALERSGVSAAGVDQIIMGCVLSAGLGQAPARQAGLAAGLPVSAQATTVNKMCGSGMQAVIMGHDALIAGSADVIVAGGMESMSGAPYLLAKHRDGARLGHDRLIDSMFVDGLEDAYQPGKLMGVFADEAARAHLFTREAQDAYAFTSLTRALRAQANGAFEREIVAVNVSGKAIVSDEQPTKGDPSRIPNLKPAFSKDGTVTAASASSISDGAAALVLARRSTAERLGLNVVATIVAHAAHAGEPSQFTQAPVPAMQMALQKAGWKTSDVDLFEVNEAFAVVAMIAGKMLRLNSDTVNINGGACALGHPIGASGARILCTLLAALEARGGRRGVASLCIGGGEATALALELCR